MKKYILPIISAGLLLTGCSAAYKTGQTPDDVYYSQPKQSVAVIQQESEPGTEYQSYFKNEDDAYLRMKVQNGGKWNTIDDFDYWYGYNSYNPYMSPYSSGYSLGYNSYWGMNTFSITYGSYNPWFSSYYFSPYKMYTPYCPVVINKRPTYYSNGFRPSLSGYSNSNYDRGGNYRVTKPSSSQSTFRNIFNSGGSNSGSYDRPSRSSNSSGSYSTPSSSGSSGGGSRSSGSSSGGTSSGGRGGRGGL